MAAYKTLSHFSHYFNPSIASSFCVYSAVQADQCCFYFVFSLVLFPFSHGSPVRHPEFYLSSCTGYFRGLMCCFRYATCSSGSCGVKGKSSCLMYKLTMGSVAVSNKYCWRWNRGFCLFLIYQFLGLTVGGLRLLWSPLPLNAANPDLVPTSSPACCIQEREVQETKGELE